MVDARSRPGCVLCFLFLHPRADRTLQPNLATFGFYVNFTRIQCCMAQESRLDFFLDSKRSNAGLKNNVVADPSYAGQLRNRVRSGISLEMPLDLAAQRDPAIVNHCQEMLR